MPKGLGYFLAILWNFAALTFTGIGLTYGSLRWTNWNKLTLLHVYYTSTDSRPGLVLATMQEVKSIL